LRRLSAGHSPGTTRAAIINAHYSRMSGIYAARRTEDDAPRRQPRPAAAASPPCRPRAASRRRGPSRRRTLRLFRRRSWRGARTGGSVKAREAVKRRELGQRTGAFRKGFLTIPNQIIGRQSRVQCCRPPGFEV
jgi:hypothetical protein